MTEILIKRLSKEVALPRYETVGSSGLDLAACISKNIEIKPGKSEIIPTGIAVSIPKNFEIPQCPCDKPKPCWRHIFFLKKGNL